MIDPFLAVYIAFAFTIMLTFCHHSELKKRYADFKAFILYFISFFTFFTLLPCAYILFRVAKPLACFTSLGITLGHVARGAAILALAIPITVLAGFIGSKDQNMKAQYPFSKQACTRPAWFLYYELSYFALYYFSWEFMFRGLLFFPFLQHNSLLVALAIQTTVSTVYHIGHPSSEIWSACAAGFIFGWIAFYTGSIIYTFLIHACVGISNDIFLYLRYHVQSRQPSGESA